jgi:hydroxymethylglutaryl-CoA lyase
MGGCPMAKDDLTGNMPTEQMIYYFDEINEDLGINWKELNKSMVWLKNYFTPAESYEQL